MQAPLMNLPPGAAARLAGVLYLFVIVGGLFAEGFVRGQLVVSGDAAATARNILEHETLYRLGFAVHLAYLGCAAAVGVILYRLLRSVSPGLALLALCLDLVAIAIEAGSLLNHMAVLTWLTDAGLAGVEPAQRHAMAYAHTRAFANGFGGSLAFFGLFCVATGVLLVRSRLVPGLIGKMMVLAGACYLVNSYAFFLAPNLAGLLFPWILLPCLLAELSLALWLLSKGIRRV